MTGPEVRETLDAASAFIADALEDLATRKGSDDPSVIAGRRVRLSLTRLSEEAVLVTEESLATAIGRVWPYRRNSGSQLSLSAAAILAALRART